MLPGVRTAYGLIALAVLGMMGVALYMEHGMGLEPCPLCVSQRLFVILTGIWALAAFLHNPRGLGRKIYPALGGLSALAGAAVASRQIWLQSLPADQVPACGPGVSYIMDTFPFMEALKVMLTGDGNCAEVAWSLLGISLPGWTLVGFLGLIAVNVWQGGRR